MHAVLDRLPHRYGDALEWKYVEGRSVEEIGERLGIGHDSGAIAVGPGPSRISARAGGRVRRVGAGRAGQLEA